MSTAEDEATVHDEPLQITRRLVIVMTHALLARSLVASEKRSIPC